MMFGLLIETGGSWRAGHLMNADEFIAAEDAAVYAAMDGLYWLATFGSGKKGNGDDREALERCESLRALRRLAVPVAIRSVRLLVGGGLGRGFASRGTLPRSR